MKYTYYPLGTIVYIHSNNGKWMIYGRKQIHNGNQQLFDYVACSYPQGVSAPEVSLFNHEHIQEVIAMGFVDESERTFSSLLQVEDETRDIRSKRPEAE